MDPEHEKLFKEKWKYLKIDSITAPNYETMQEGEGGYSVFKDVHACMKGCGCENDKNDSSGEKK